jgi:hypothetical protein
MSQEEASRTDGISSLRDARKILDEREYLSEASPLNSAVLSDLAVRISYTVNSALGSHPQKRPITQVLRAMAYLISKHNEAEEHNRMMETVTKGIQALKEETLEELSNKITEVTAKIDSCFEDHLHSLTTPTQNAPLDTESLTQQIVKAITSLPTPQPTTPSPQSYAQAAAIPVT